MVDAAHKLHQHVDFRVVREFARVGGKDGVRRQGHAARLGGVAYQHFFEDDVAPRAVADDLRIFLQQPYQAAAHGAVAGQCRHQGFVTALGHSCSVAAAGRPAQRVGARAVSE